MASRASSDQDGGPEGDQTFERLVEAHYGDLFRFAMSLARTEADAGDLVQETFLTWARKGHQLKELSKAKAWLFTTLHRQYLAANRRIVRFPEVDLESVEAELPEVEAPTLEGVDGRRAVALLAAVDEQYRPVLSLFFLEDASYPEIAEILEIPLGTVKSRLYRGMAQLKQLAAEPGGLGAAGERARS